MFFSYIIKHGKWFLSQFLRAVDSLPNTEVVPKFWFCEKDTILESLMFRNTQFCGQVKPVSTTGVGHFRPFHQRQTATPRWRTSGVAVHKIIRSRTATMCHNPRFFRVTNWDKMGNVTCLRGGRRKLSYSACLNNGMCWCGVCVCGVCGVCVVCVWCVCGVCECVCLRGHFHSNTSNNFFHICIYDDFLVETANCHIFRITGLI
jgi:hypothetical protein